MQFSSLLLNVHWESKIGFGQTIIRQNDDGKYYIDNECLNKVSIIHILKELVKDLESADVTLANAVSNETENIFERTVYPIIKGVKMLINKRDEKLAVLDYNGEYWHNGVHVPVDDTIQVLCVQGHSTASEFFYKNIMPFEYITEFLCS